MKDSYQRYAQKVFKRLDIDPKASPGYADLLKPGINGSRSQQRSVELAVEMLRDPVERWKKDGRP